MSLVHPLQILTPAKVSCEVTWVMDDDPGER
jgi:hypothetical protein